MENVGRRLTRAEARALQQGIGVAGLAAGAACLLVPGWLSRATGFKGHRRESWWVRLFGVRDLVFGAALLTAEGREASRQAAQMVAAAQVGDLVVSTAMLIGGALPFRAWLLVAATAPPTLVAAVAVAENLRTE